MGFKAEQECPQCGALLELDEADHILDCPFCNTKSFLSVPDYYRFVLPHQQNEADLVYVPYLRFRGSVFSCHETTIKHRIADITHLGTPLNALPPSLGFRPQALKLHFASPELPGTFLKNFLDVDNALKKVTTYSAITDKIYHQAQIGEILSLIYLPLAVRDSKLHDAITGDLVAKLPDDHDVFSKVRDKHTNWKMTSLATICPQCGWNLDGAKGSVALSCDNCKTVWEATDRGFSQISFESCQTTTNDPLFMPFWRITTSSVGVAINSVADYIRETNQPRMPQKEWEDIPMNFWCPAFKIRPKIFLQLASQLTNSQRNLKATESLPKFTKLYPVTLPKSEAVQSLKIILANTATNKKKIMPLLAETNFSISAITLAYVPFSDNGYNLFQDDVRANINKKVLEWAGKL
jgi:rubredoxin/DNA-directed RNA polymerase subunit RPC12/RpoP